MGNKKNFLFLFCMAAFLFIVSPVFADAPALPAELLLFTQKELVVTATRTAMPITKSPSAVTVITREEILRAGTTHIPEILRSVVGVDVARVSFGYSDVNIRGLNKALSSRTLVLVDGRTVFVNGQGFTPWEGIPISIEDIKRIEVVKGPAEALYGSPALCGVINIITRDPEEVEGTESNTSVGTYGTYRQSLLQGGDINEKAAYKVSAEFSRAATFEGLNITDNNLLNTEYFEDQALERKVFNASLAFNIDEQTSLDVSGGINNADYIFLTDPTTGLGPVNQYSRFINIRYSHLPGEGREFQIQGFMDKETMTATSFCLSEESFIDIYDLTAHYAFPMGERHNLLYGGGMRYERMDSNLFTPVASAAKEEFTWDLFLQDEVELLDNLDFFGTLRYDHHPKSGYNTAYRASLVYEPVEDHMFWASVGETFRNPTFTESMVNINYSVQLSSVPGVYVNTSSPEELRPEKMRSYEIGYRGLVLERVKPEVTVFFNELRNYICATTDVAGPPTLTTEKNQGRVNIFGTEIGANYLVTDWLKTFANYTYLHVKRTDDILQDDCTPEDKANLGASLTFDNNEDNKFMVDIISTFVGPCAAPGLTGGGKIGKYQLTNIRVGYEYKDWLETSIYVFNLFKDKHKEFTGALDLGTRVIGKCTIKF
ncbi:MAG: hypothetical protein DRP74_05270 [Candidatus Omnitrophota bacterium]|nr:MAG: hypothetical protein DRP74_05270 [Candidatus Omnitrophota bacterium]